MPQKIKTKTEFSGAKKLDCLKLWQNLSKLNNYLLINERPRKTRLSLNNKKTIGITWNIF